MSDQDIAYDPYPDQVAADEQLAQLAATRSQVIEQTQELEGNIGSLRAAQKRAAEVAQTASVELAIAQGGDFYAPDVGQQISPNGTVTYDFDAHLHARGIDLDAYTTASPPGDRTIRWSDATGGVVADVEGYTIPPGDRIAKLGAYGAGTGAGRAILQGRSPGGTAGELRAEYDDASGAIRGFVLAGSRAATILDHNGRSNYLQLDGLRKSLSGAAVVTFAGTSAGSGFAIVTHGLGAAPFVVATVNAGSSTGAVGYAMATVFDVTASTFTLGARAGSGAAPPAGTQVTINWIAWAAG
jgi:hypothetical protein